MKKIILPFLGLLLYARPATAGFFDTVASGVSSAVDTVASGVSSAVDTVSAAAGAAVDVAGAIAGAAISALVPSVPTNQFADTLASFAGNAGSDMGAMGCFFCPMFSALFDASNNLATNVSTKLGDLFLILLGIGLLFTIAFKVGRMVVSMQEVDLMQFLGDLFKTLGRGIIASVLLVYSLGIFYYIVSPIMESSLHLANAVYTEAGAKQLAIVQVARDNGVNLTVKCKVPKPLQSGDKEMAFSPSVKTALICNLQQVSATLLVGIALGAVIFLASFILGVFGVIPNFLATTCGGIMLTFFFGVMCSYSLKLLEAFIRIAIVAALMPLWIIFWVFPPTVKFTQRAWTMLLGGCFSFIALSVAMAFIMVALDTAMFPETFIQHIQDGEILAAIKTLSVSFLITIGLMLLCAPMIGSFETLANSISGAMGIGAADSLGKVVSQATQAAGNAANLGGKVGRLVANPKQRPPEEAKDEDKSSTKDPDDKKADTKGGNTPPPAPTGT